MNEILRQSLLFDFYGELLTSHQKDIYEQYILEDLSLGEIAKEAGVSRQAVHDIVKRCEQALLSYEGKLHLVERFLLIRDNVKEIDLLLDSYQEDKDPEILVKVRKVSEKILEEL